MGATYQPGAVGTYPLVVTLTVDDLELAAVLSSTHLQKLEWWKDKLTKQRR